MNEEIEIIGPDEDGQQELANRISQGAVKNPLIKHPGDKVTQYMTDHQDIITKAETQEFKATHRQYTKKDGTPGKQTITLMQPDGKRGRND